MSSLEKALEIAAKAHAGQKQRNGEPYILHPLSVMSRVDSLPEKIAAVLHDVIEDSPWTIRMLKLEGFSDDVLETVNLLTRYDTDDYETYINKLQHHPAARRIKMADLQDNMNVSRLKNLKEKDFGRLKRYHTYWKQLMAIEQG